MTNNGDTVSIYGLTITRGGPYGDGGGIYNDGSGTMALRDSTVTGNTVTDNTVGDGGGIYNNSGTVTLELTNVTGNTPDNCAPPGSVRGCTS